MTRKLFYQALTAIALTLAPAFYLAGYMGHTEVASRVRLYTRAEVQEAMETLYDERTEHCDARVFNLLYQIDHQGYQFDLADTEVVLWPRKTKRSIGEK